MIPSRDAALLWLEQFLEKQKPGFADDARLVDAAKKLSEAYTQKGERALDDDAAASLAYLAHFGPRAIVAVSRALRALPADARGVVVDVGAGSGASALAWALAGAARVDLVERSQGSLDLAKKLLGFGGGTNFTTTRAAITDVSPNKEASVLSAAFVLGELKEMPELRKLAPNARDAVFVDAGDHARARRLQALRDVLVQDAGVVVYGPCGHRDPCPALVRERDWCHDRVAKALPERLARFAKNVGRDEQKMSLSWLAFGKAAPGQAVARNDIVVIGEPLREKGRVRLPVCGAGGLRFVQVLKRDKAAHDVVRDLERGQRLAGRPADSATTNDATTETWHISDISEMGELT